MIDALVGKVLFCLVLCTVSMLTGAKLASDHMAAKQLQAEQATHAKYMAEVDRHRGIADDVSMKLNEERANADARNRLFAERLRRAGTAEKSLATCGKNNPQDPATVLAAGNTGAQSQAAVEPPRSGLRLTSEFVSLYDDAVRLSVPAAGDTRPVDASSPAAGTVGPEDVLEVTAANSAICGAIRSQVMGWQALARKEGWAR